jgi:hypothetical protein
LVLIKFIIESIEALNSKKNCIESISDDPKGIISY